MRGACLLSAGGQFSDSSQSALTLAAFQNRVLHERINITLKLCQRLLAGSSVKNTEPRQHQHVSADRELAVQSLDVPMAASMAGKQRPTRESNALTSVTAVNPPLSTCCSISVQEPKEVALKCVRS